MQVQCSNCGGYKVTRQSAGYGPSYWWNTRTHTVGDFSMSLRHRYPGGANVFGILVFLAVPLVMAVGAAASPGSMSRVGAAILGAVFGFFLGFVVFAVTTAAIKGRFRRETGFVVKRDRFYNYSCDLCGYQWREADDTTSPSPGTRAPDPELLQKALQEAERKKRELPPPWPPPWES